MVLSSAATLQSAPPRDEANHVIQIEELPLTIVLDRLTEMGQGNSLDLEELSMYRGLCALEAEILGRMPYRD